VTHKEASDWIFGKLSTDAAIVALGAAVTFFRPFMVPKAPEVAWQAEYEDDIFLDNVATAFLARVTVNVYTSADDSGDTLCDAVRACMIGAAFAMTGSTPMDATALGLTETALKFEGILRGEDIAP
jgi:hypothetical protein